MIELISTDFDGTIFAEFENPPIPERLLGIIADLQKRGAKWVINTGRDMSSLMEALGRAKIPIEPDFLVLVEREIHCHDGVRYVGLEEWNSKCTRSHDDLFARILPDMQRLTDWVNARFHATVYEDTYSPFCLIAGNKNDAEVINKFLDDYCRGIPNLAVVRNDVYTRLSHSGYHKGAGLAELSRRLGIGAEHVFAAGDHWNDLPMLLKRYAHWLAAPCNAIEEVKAQVRQEGGVVSELPHGDGVAEALERYLKGQKG
jgi:hydroxymethylpyrimidine pyrophosphatase-like HAD family hydrolase